jgi:NarL family two-component system response regulator LiaR
VIRILIVDDHALMRQSLREICTHLGRCAVVADAGSGGEAVALWRATQPDVVLMDLSLPDVDGTEAIRVITREAPASRIIAFTMYRAEWDMVAAVRAGARACLLKTVDAAELVAAIQAVHRGEYLADPIIAARVLEQFRLPPPSAPQQSVREKDIQVLRLVAQGLDNREIAAALQAPMHAVANRLRVVFDRLQVTNRTQAAIYALRQGWATLDGGVDK